MEEGKREGGALASVRVELELGLPLIGLLDRLGLPQQFHVLDQLWRELLGLQNFINRLLPLGNVNLSGLEEKQRR